MNIASDKTVFQPKYIFFIKAGFGQSFELNFSETVQRSTCNLSFHGEIRKNVCPDTVIM